MHKKDKAKTRWFLLLLQIIFICSLCVLYGIFFADMVESFIIMIGTSGLVIILHGLLGSVEQSKIDL